jgi:hypothetical protein
LSAAVGTIVGVAMIVAARRSRHDTHSVRPYSLRRAG